MKFLCIECDTSMALISTSGPDNGSMQVLFKCRSCCREIAMLTNAMETQMVHSLGVKIGPSGAEGAGQEKAKPMGMIRSSLRGYSDFAGAADTDTAAGAAGTVAADTADTVAASADVSKSPHHGTTQTISDVDTTESTSKCPFTGMVNEQMEKQAESEGPVWTPEAEARMAQIPSFIRPMVQKGIEEHARSNKCPIIDEALIDSVRNSMGMQMSSDKPGT